MTNPLLQKYDEIYGKKEEPKPTKPPIIEYYDEVGPIPSKEVIERLQELQPKSFISTTNASVSINSRPPSLVSYDPHSINDSFFQVAELMKNGTAKVISMTMNTDVVGKFYTGKKTITFEVDIWDNP